MKKNCKNCNIEFETNNLKKVFCCKSCCSKYNHNNQTINEFREERRCEICGENFICMRKRPTKTCSEKCLSILRKDPTLQKKRMETLKNTMIERHGVTHPSQMESTKKSIKKKRKEGSYSNMVENMKKTLFEKYGDENYVNVKKNKETKLIKYGNENYNNRKQATKTTIERFGVEHAMQTDEIKDKVAKTTLKNHGVKCLFEKKEIRDLGKKVIIEKYGTEHYTQSDEYKEKRFKEEYRKLVNNLHKVNIELIEEYNGNSTNKSYGGLIKYKFKCLKCDHKFESKIGHNHYPICRKCNPINRFNSDLNKIIIVFLDEYGIDYIENYRQLIYPLEVDFYLPDFNLAIELNGNYWHSEVGGGKDKSYHLNKTIECNKKGVKLIHIFEDELKLKKDIVLSRLLNMLGLSNNKIYARKCEIKEIKNRIKTRFLENNHLQGNCNDKIRFGLFHNNKLMSVMTFGKLRRVTGNKDKKNNYELIRFCSKINSNVIGGFSKLLKYFIKKHNPSNIITYADVRWSGIEPLNTLYNKNGFNFIHKSEPSYFYRHKNRLNREHRFNYRKSVLKNKLETFDPKLTEWENMQLNGYDRIWDCGSLKFELNCGNYLGI